MLGHTAKAKQSYWYDAFTKKHILICLSMIPVALIGGPCIQWGSFAGGCVATLSRTLDDWLFVEADAASFELIPYVYMPYEPGCIDWQGFSTCEDVQFAEWK